MNYELGWGFACVDFFFLLELLSVSQPVSVCKIHNCSLYLFFPFFFFNFFHPPSTYFASTYMQPLESLFIKHPSMYCTCTYITNPSLGCCPLNLFLFFYSYYKLHISPLCYQFFCDFWSLILLNSRYQGSYCFFSTRAPFSAAPFQYSFQPLYFSKNFSGGFSDWTLLGNCPITFKYYSFYAN